MEQIQVTNLIDHLAQEYGEDSEAFHTGIKTLLATLGIYHYEMGSYAVDRHGHMREYSVTLYWCDANTLKFSDASGDGPTAASALHKAMDGFQLERENAPPLYDPALVYLLEGLADFQAKIEAMKNSMQWMQAHALTLMHKCEILRDGVLSIHTAQREGRPHV